MPRLNPFLGRRPAPLTDSKPLTDASSGNTDTFYLQYLDDTLAGKASDELTRLIADYMGDPRTKTPPRLEPLEVDGFPVLLSQTFLSNIVTAWAMQTFVVNAHGLEVRPDGASIYTAEDLIALSVTEESLWEQVKAFAEELNAEGNKRKNGSRLALQANGSGSKTPSDGDSLTPNSLPEPTPSSVLSTNDSELSANTSFETEAAAT